MTQESTSNNPFVEINGTLHIRGTIGISNNSKIYQNLKLLQNCYADNNKVICNWRSKMVTTEYFKTEQEAQAHLSRRLELAKKFA